ncbi:MAG: hypothetical protein QOE27_1176, partial [Solirubrobacteraceae bacterium]|nr:hypothetical protein [Solirubrobacteraceae bacterium]
MVAVLSGLGPAWAPAVSSAKVGPRVTVAVYGDSIVEGYTIPHYLRYGLVPELGTVLAGIGGFELGG